MAEKAKIEEVEAAATGTRDLVDSALKRLHEAVDNVVGLAEPTGLCPYVQKPCPLWDELSRLRKQNGNLPPV